MPSGINVRPVVTKADRKAFVDLAWDVYRDDPAWVPPLKSEVHALLDPAKNPWFGHARAALWLAERDGKPVGRISAQVDELVLEHMGAGTGQWGMFEALDGEAAAAAHRHRRGLAAGPGHDPRVGPDQPVDLGRAGAVDQGLRPAADGDDGPPPPRISRMDRGRRLCQGQGPFHLRARHPPRDGPADGAAGRFGRTQPAHPHPHRRQGPFRQRGARSSSTCSTTHGRTIGGSCP